MSFLAQGATFFSKDEIIGEAIDTENRKAIITPMYMVNEGINKKLKEMVEYKPSLKEKRFLYRMVLKSEIPTWKLVYEKLTNNNCNPPIFKSS